MAIAEIIALPRFPQAYTRAQLDEITAIESRGAIVVGYVARLLQMGDGDYHIQITAVAPGRCLGSDTPDQLITELTPGVRSRRPNYAWEALVPLCGAATQIRLTGWLFYDSPHQDDVGRSTPWEVHPVTRIEVCCWRGAWVEGLTKVAQPAAQSERESFSTRSPRTSRSLTALPVFVAPSRAGLDTAQRGRI